MIYFVVFCIGTKEHIFYGQEKALKINKYKNK